jgi:uracil-DNA glycosylase family 4
MDARQRLRIYLEQRREMGEVDLVLDTMSVEEVLKLVGSVSKERPQILRSASSEPKSGVTRVLPESPVTQPADLPPGITVGKPPALGFDDIARLASLEAIADAVRHCTRCPLHLTAKNAVPGEGHPQARFVCVGEAPGATEDETGRPFVGAAGQLLTKILAAIDLRREDVFICNVMKHRPPGNRNPMPDEITACSPYLVRQLELIKPGVILALGTFAAQTLLETKESIGKLRGRIHRYHGIPLVVTYHPAALLRNPSWKRPTWDDVQLARRILDSSALAGA